MFQSTPSGGKATGRRAPDCGAGSVSIHAFRGEGDARQTAQRYAGGCVSIHAFRGEGDLLAIEELGSATGFNPRLPGGRRRSGANPSVNPRSFNPRLPGGRRLRDLVQRAYHRAVSIHAFRGEGDSSGTTPALQWKCFNPRLPGGRRLRRAMASIVSPCFNPRLPGGRRPAALRMPEAQAVFQSTPSGGKATV